MKKIRFRVTIRMLGGAVLGLLMAIIWIGSHPSAADAQCGGTIPMGSTLRGQISGIGTTCSYYFAGGAGDAVTIRMNKVSSGLDPFLELYTPQGSLAGSDDDGGGNGNSMIKYTLTSRGRYRIRARDHGRGAGVFTISLEKSSGFVRNRLSGRCIDVDGMPGTANRARLQLWDCELSGRGPNNSNTDQKWELRSDGLIMNVESRKCIDVDGAPGTANRARLQLWDCEFSGRGPNNTPTDQMWELGSDGFIRNRLSGKCIDVDGAPGVANGAFLQLWDCESSGRGPNNSSTDQKWLMQ